MKRLSSTPDYFTPLFAAFTQQKEHLSLDDYANYESVANPTLSPRWRLKYLYTRQWINLVEDKRESDLWIVNSDGTQNQVFHGRAVMEYGRPTAPRLHLLRRGSLKADRFM